MDGWSVRLCGIVAIPGAWRLVTGLMQSTSGSLTSINPKEPDALAVAIRQRAERLRSGVAASEEAEQQRQEPVQQTKEAMQQTKDPPDPQLPVSSPLVVAQPAPAPLVQAPEPSPRPLDTGTFSPGLTALSGRMKSVSSASATSSSMTLNEPFACVSWKAMRNW